MALSDFDVINVDIRNAYPVFLEIFSHELNANGGRVLKLKFYEGSSPLSLTGLTITATFVTDGYLVAEDVAVTQGANDICSLDISNTSNYTLLPGTMLIELKFTATGDVVYCPPTAMIVKVAESIMTDAHVTPESYGTVSEILQEVANARGNFANLNARLTNDETRLTNAETRLTDDETRLTAAETDILGKLNFSGTATSFDDCTQPNTLYNVVADNKNYLVGVFNPNAQWRFEGSEGIKTRVKINGTWREWVWVAKVGITDEVITARGVYANLDERFQAIEENEAEIINIGTVAQLSDLDSAAYCSENAEFVFAAGNDLKHSLGIAQANNAACSLKYNNGVQALKAYSDGTAHSEVTISRKINSIAPTFSADIWSGTKIDGSKAIATGTIPFNALNTALKNRITALETAVPEKADYATINAIFDANKKLLDVSKDVTHPALSSDATSLYLDKKATTISKSTLLAYYPNLTKVYVDNNETDVTITGTGELTFVFKGDFNAGQLLYLGISKAINDTNTRLTTLENTVGTLNSAIASQLNLNEGA